MVLITSDFVPSSPKKTSSGFDGIRGGGGGGGAVKKRMLSVAKASLYIAANQPPWVAAAERRDGGSSSSDYSEDERDKTREVRTLVVLFSPGNPCLFR